MDATSEVPETRSQLKLGLLFLAAGLFVFLLGLTFVPAVPEDLRWLPNLRFSLYRALTH